MAFRLLMVITELPAGKLVRKPNRRCASIILKGGNGLGNNCVLHNVWSILDSVTCACMCEHAQTLSHRDISFPTVSRCQSPALGHLSGPSHLTGSASVPLTLRTRQCNSTPRAGWKLNQGVCSMQTSPTVFFFIIIIPNL